MEVSLKVHLLNTSYPMPGCKEAGVMSTEKTARGQIGQTDLEYRGGLRLLVGDGAVPAQRMLGKTLSPVLRRHSAPPSHV